MTTSRAPAIFDFSVVFPTQFAAERFAEQFRERGYGVKIESSRVEEGLPWDVTVVNNMVPSHAAISDFEHELQQIADSLGGENDGWGCFSEPGKFLH